MTAVVDFNIYAFRSRAQNRLIANQKLITALDNFYNKDQSVAAQVFMVQVESMVSHSLKFFITLFIVAKAGTVKGTKSCRESAKKARGKATSQAAKPGGEWPVA